jgi:hypothetical protein
VQHAIDQDLVVEDAMKDQVRSEYEDPYGESNLRRGPAHHRLPTERLTSGAQLRDEAASAGGIVSRDDVTDLAQIGSGASRHDDRLQGAAFSMAA